MAVRFKCNQPFNVPVALRIVASFPIPGQLSLVLETRWASRQAGTKLGCHYEDVFLMAYC